MKKLLERSAMFDEAALGGKGHHWIIELLIFIPVFIAVSIPEAVIITAAMFIWIFTGSPLIPAMGGSLGMLAQTGDISSYINEVRNTVALVTSSMPEWMMLVQLFATVGTTVMVILFCRVIEKRKPASLGLRKGNIVGEYLVGAAIGAVMLAASVGICAAFGGLTFGAGDFRLGIWLLYLLGFILQGASEEILCRGYLMVSIARKNPLWLAVILSSLVFAALHLANPGITVLAFINLFLCGCVFAVYVIKRGNLWGACAMHSLWNFFQGNFFGVSVSGMAKMPSVLSSEPVAGMDLFNGGAFGLEGGIAVTVVELAALVLLLFVVPAKKTDGASVEAA